MENEFLNAKQRLYSSYESIIPEAKAELKRNGWNDCVGTRLKERVELELQSELKRSLIPNDLESVMNFDLDGIILAYKSAKEILEGKK